MNKAKELGIVLDNMFSNPVCELNYQKDYELLIAVVLSAQTTDKRVNMVTLNLWKKYPSLEALSDGNLEDIMDIIRPIGTFHKKALFIKKIAHTLVESYQGIVPNDRTILESLPGVGRKTANVVLSNIYNVPSIAVDTHVNRVSKRIGLASSNDTVLQVEQKLMKRFPKKEWSKRHHQLVLFGRYHCKAMKPNCKECPCLSFCKNKQV